MAIEAYTTRITQTDQPGLCGRNLERIARATIGGRRQTAAAVVESAAALLSCESAVLLQPTGTPGVLRATWATHDDDAADHALWEPGPCAAQLFERSCHTADGWREPWSGLRIKLLGLGVRSWAALPLREEGRPRPLGLIVVGCSTPGDRPCPRLHRLPDLALSATAALSAAPEDGATTEAHPAPSVHQQHAQTLSNLAFGVSHTLGNIFGAILGNLQFLQEEATSDSAARLISRIERSTTDGVELMRSLQAYAAIPAEAAMKTLDLSEIAAEVASLIRALTGHWPSFHRVEIETELAEAAPVWADGRHLRQSIINVVFNAVQAVGREGRVTIRTGCDGGFSEVRVIDDGPGMSGEVRRRATEPFFTTYPALHQGLGLTVARGIAVGH
ncbi:MAG: sensor histidine kinase, partial [Armatimonadota bacterium]